MEPSQLVAPQSPLGLPAPYWMIVSLKVAGFTLHAIPMNLWYAGILVAMLLRLTSHPPACQWSARFMRQMPIIVALGVNFGIVPLLFLQVAYYRVFYPATVLTAWPWLTIIALLLVAYHGIYIYIGGLSDTGHVGRLRRAVGWASAVAFIAIGFLFANGLSLMTNLQAWEKLWASSQVAGAALGTSFNVGDPTLFPRWLMMFGLALTTTAAYARVDAGLLAASEGEAYQRWVSRFSIALYSLGSFWFALMGSWYAFGTWQPKVQETMFRPPTAFLTGATALSPGLVWLLLVRSSRVSSKKLIWAIAISQLGVLALNATSRQLVQNLELAPYVAIGAEPVNLQLVPLVLFLVLLAAGLGTILWMLSNLARASQGQQ